MPNLVTVEKFADLSGYTPKAVRNKVHDGTWPYGVWVKAPDGRILIDQRAYDEWAISGQAQKRPVIPASKSVSHIKASGAGSASSSSPPPLI